MSQIIIKVVPHEHQRYNTVGDYYEYLNDDIVITVSETGNPKYNLLVAIHEYIECSLCKMRNISIDSIDAFDINFERTRAPDNFDEPGNSPDAPYYKEHQFATKIERLIAAELGVKWDEYEKVLDKLYLPDTSFNFPASSDNSADDQC